MSPFQHVRRHTSKLPPALHSRFRRPFHSLATRRASGNRGDRCSRRRCSRRRVCRSGERWRRYSHDRSLPWPQIDPAYGALYRRRRDSTVWFWIKRRTSAQAMPDGTVLSPPEKTLLPAGFHSVGLRLNSAHEFAAPKPNTLGAADRLAFCRSRLDHPVPCSAGRTGAQGAHVEVLKTDCASRFVTPPALSIPHSSQMLLPNGWPLALAPDPAVS